MRTELRATVLLWVAITVPLAAATRAEPPAAVPASAKEVEPARAPAPKLDAQYRLADGENAKLVRPPFSAERDAFHRHHHRHVGEVAGQYGLHWKDGIAERWSWSSDPGTVASAMKVADVDLVDLEGHRDLFELPVPGDWVVRDGADREAVLADVARILAEVTDGRVRVEPAKVEKDVVVARGRYAFKPHPEAPRDKDDVHLFTGTMDPNSDSGGGGSGSLTEFLRHATRYIDQKIVNESEPRDPDVSWRNNRDAYDGKKSLELRDRLLKNLAAQTGLEFRVERREVDVWRVIDEKDQAGGL